MISDPPKPVSASFEHIRDFPSTFRDFHLIFRWKMQQKIAKFIKMFRQKDVGQINRNFLGPHSLNSINSLNRFARLHKGSIHNTSISPFMAKNASNTRWHSKWLRITAWLRFFSLFIFLKNAFRKSLMQFCSKQPTFTAVWSDKNADVQLSHNKHFSNYELVLY